MACRYYMVRGFLPYNDKISNTAFSYFLAVLRKTGGQYRDKQYAWEMEFSHVFSLLL